MPICGIFTRPAAEARLKRIATLILRHPCFARHRMTVYGVGCLNYSESAKKCHKFVSIMADNTVLQATCDLRHQFTQCQLALDRHRAVKAQ